MTADFRCHLIEMATTWKVLTFTKAEKDKNKDLTYVKFVLIVWTSQHIFKSTLVELKTFTLVAMYRRWQWNPAVTSSTWLQCKKVLTVNKAKQNNLRQQHIGNKNTHSLNNTNSCNQLLAEVNSFRMVPMPMRWQRISAGTSSTLLSCGTYGLPPWSQFFQTN